VDYWNIYHFLYKHPITSIQYTSSSLPLHEDLSHYRTCALAQAESAQLTSDIQTQSSDVWVDEAQVEWRVELVGVGQSDE